VITLIVTISADCSGEQFLGFGGAEAEHAVFSSAGNGAFMGADLHHCTVSLHASRNKVPVLLSLPRFTYHY